MDETEFKDLVPHPFANLLPWIKNDQQFGELVEDIRKNGLVSPIILFQGQILDGRNRHKACVTLGEAFEFSEAHHIKRFNGTDAEALDFVESLNVHRRHLTPSQRAMAASSMLALRMGDEPVLTGNGGNALAEVADSAAAAGVSEFMVLAANRVRGICPENICRMIEDGSVTLAAAQRVSQRLTKARMARLTTPEKVNAAASISGAKRFKTWSPNRLVQDIGQLAEELGSRGLDDGSIDKAAIDAAIARLEALRGRTRELQSV